MTDAATIAWIFYALGLASEKSPADFGAISQLADGLNHAVPKHQEMQTSLKWLAQAGLAVQTSGGYSLSSAGTDLLNDSSSTTARQVLAHLTDRIASRIALSPNPSLERTRDR